MQGHHQFKNHFGAYFHPDKAHRVTGFNGGNDKRPQDKGLSKGAAGKWATLYVVRKSDGKKEASVDFKIEG